MSLLRAVQDLPRTALHRAYLQSRLVNSGSSNDPLVAEAVPAVVKDAELISQGTKDMRRATLVLALEADKKQTFTEKDKRWLISRVTLGDLDTGLVNYSARLHRNVIKPALPPSSFFYTHNPSLARELDAKMVYLMTLVRDTPSAALAYSISAALYKDTKRKSVKKTRDHSVHPELSPEDLKEFYADEALGIRPMPRPQDVAVVMATALGTRANRIELTVDDALNLLKLKQNEQQNTADSELEEAEVDESEEGSG